ncbi:MAG TPA: dihydrolipoamide acetyltransferase family protein [Gaiella sp.]|nr:dihydrolipoamide acetyltransferase family protein [Gaiella sp.]
MSTGTQVEVVMPQMGVSVSEGTVTKWLKQPGDEVALDESLLEISTDKVDTEVPSPGEGVLAEIRVQEGETVEVGTVLATIAPAGAEPAAEQAPSAAEPAAPPPEAAAAPPEPTAEAPPAAEPSPEPVAAAAPDAEAPAAQPQPSAPPMAAPTGNGKTFVSPVVARIAAEHGVDPSAIAGTGQGGRVTKKDILAFIESGGADAAQAPPEAPAAPTPEAAPAAAAAPAPQPAPAAAAPTAPAAPAEAPAAQAPVPPVTPAAPTVGEHEEPMNAMRRGIAEHMRRSLDTSAHVTSAIEVDMSKVVAARETLKKEYQAKHGVNPTYLAFVAKAAIETLANWPWVNGELRGEKIVTRSFVNLGIAVSLEEGKGLIVPVIRNAQDLNLLGLARAIADIAERARTKKLMPDDVQGGTFTITNPGGYGTFHGTPVISQPQAAILGTYALVKRPWVVQDALGQDVIAIRPMMNVTLTYDHRLVDGAYSGGFLRDLRERLEGWGDADE